MFEIKTNSLFCIQFIGLLCHCKGSLTESRHMRLQTALEPSVLQCQFFRAFIIWKLHESKQSIWNRTKSKKIERKKGRQEQTSKLQIKACEMQPRIADPYWARGWGGRGGSVGGGGGWCASFSQNTEPRGEPLMAERDMSTFRMGVQQQQRDSRHTLPEDRAPHLSGSDPFWHSLTENLCQHCDFHQLSCFDWPTGAVPLVLKS